MLNKALEAFGDLGDDEELGPADWPTVRGYIASLNNVDSEHVHPHAASERDNNRDLTNLKDIRERLLNGKFVSVYISVPDTLTCYAYKLRHLYFVDFCKHTTKILKDACFLERNSLRSF